MEESRIRREMAAAARRRRSAATAWPAFPGEHGGVSAMEREHSNDLGDASPMSSSSSHGVGIGASTTKSSTCKSPGGSMRRKSSSCCNSCRPSSHQQHHQHSSQQQHAKNGGRIEYDDVFGGPPKYLPSICGSKKKMSTPDYDDIFRSTTVPKSQATSRTKSRMDELPVFDPPEYNTEVFQGAPHAVQKQTPASPISSSEVAYDDVFGGPVTGSTTKFLKDFLSCSSGAKSKASSQDSSPLSSMRSVSHGNPMYDLEDVFGARKSPSATPQAFLHMGSDRRPTMTSVSAASSAFGDQCDNSTESPGTSRNDGNTVRLRYDKMYRNICQPIEPDVEAASSSSSGSFELDFQEGGSGSGFGKLRRRHRPRRSNARKANPSVKASNNKVDSLEAESLDSTLRKISGIRTTFDHERPTNKNTVGQSQTSKSLADDDVQQLNRKEGKQVSFVTVDHVKLTTQPKSDPPARPAPSLNEEIFEKEMCELLETEAFMEYSIKDLDGLVAEEYVISHESVSGSTSSLSATSTSSSGRSHEGSDASDAEVVKEPIYHTVQSESCGESKRTASGPLEEKEVHEGTDTSGELGQQTSTTKKQDQDSSLEDSSSGTSKEELSSSSSSFGDLSSLKASGNMSGDWAALCDFEEIEGESPERRKSRWERHQRAQERVATALAEMNSRGLELERTQAEKQKVAEYLDELITRWAAGKQGNLRALLSTLQYILWPDCGWRPVSLMDIIEPAAVRKAYRKATLCVHPDKLQQKGSSVEHKYTAEKVFDYLQEAWTIFNYEQVF